MRFSEYLTYEALRENNRALHNLGSDRGPLSDAGVHELRVLVKRLLAYWRLLDGAIPAPELRTARDRLRRMNDTLARARDRAAIVETVDDLAANAPSDKVQEALNALAELLAEERTQAETPTPRVTMTIPVDLLARGFQDESRAWRELDVDAVPDEAVIDGYRISYRRGRRLGMMALDSQREAELHQWRRWAKASLGQLDLIRPALGEQSAQARFYLERLVDTLGTHSDLELVRQTLDESALQQKQIDRITGLVELRMRYCRERVAKLYPKAYRLAPKRFAYQVQNDLKGRDFVTLVAEFESISA